MDRGRRAAGGGSGSDKGDLAAPKSDVEIAEKFRGLIEDFLGAKRVNAILDYIWYMEDVKNVAAIGDDPA